MTEKRRHARPDTAQAENAAKNRPLPACGLWSSRKQEPCVTVRRSYDGFRLTCYEAAGHMLISAAWGGICAHP